MGVRHSKAFLPLCKTRASWRSENGLVSCNQRAGPVVLRVAPVAWETAGLQVFRA